MPGELWRRNERVRPLPDRVADFSVSVVRFFGARLFGAVFRIFWERPGDSGFERLANSLGRGMKRKRRAAGPPLPRKGWCLEISLVLRVKASSASEEAPWRYRQSEHLPA